MDDNIRIENYLNNIQSTKAIILEEERYDEKLEVRELKQEISKKDNRVIAVIGKFGSGKSSLIKTALKDKELKNIISFSRLDLTTENVMEYIINSLPKRTNKIQYFKLTGIIISISTFFSIVFYIVLSLAEQVLKFSLLKSILDVEISNLIISLCLGITFTIFLYNKGNKIKVVEISKIFKFEMTETQSKENNKNIFKFENELARRLNNYKGILVIEDLDRFIKNKEEDKKKIIEIIDTIVNIFTKCTNKNAKLIIPIQKSMTNNLEKEFDYIFFKSNIDQELVLHEVCNRNINFLNRNAHEFEILLSYVCQNLQDRRKINLFINLINKNVEMLNQSLSCERMQAIIFYNYCEVKFDSVNIVEKDFADCIKKFPYYQEIKKLSKRSDITIGSFQNIIDTMDDSIKISDNGRRRINEYGQYTLSNENIKSVSDIILNEFISSDNSEIAEMKKEIFTGLEKNFITKENVFYGIYANASANVIAKAMIKNGLYLSWDMTGIDSNSLYDDLNESYWEFFTNYEILEMLVKNNTSEDKFKIVQILNNLRKQSVSETEKCISHMSDAIKDIIISEKVLTDDQFIRIPEIWKRESEWKFDEEKISITSDDLAVEIEDNESVIDYIREVKRKTGIQNIQVLIKDKRITFDSFVKTYNLIYKMSDISNDFLRVYNEELFTELQLQETDLTIASKKQIIRQYLNGKLENHTKMVRWFLEKDGKEVLESDDKSDKVLVDSVVEKRVLELFTEENSNINDILVETYFPRVHRANEDASGWIPRKNESDASAKILIRHGYLKNYSAQRLTFK